MNNKNNNYRVMKFLEPVNKKDKCKGYVRLDVRGARGVIMVSVEDVGDNRNTCDVFLYKDKADKIKVGSMNSKKGMIKRSIPFNSVLNIEDYKICGVVKDNRIVLYSNLFNDVTLNDIRKLEEDVHKESVDTEKTDEEEDAPKEQAEGFKGAVDSEENSDEEIIIKDATTSVEEIAQDNSDNEITDTEISDRDLGENIEEEITADDMNQSEYDINADPTTESEGDVESASRRTGNKSKVEENLYNILGDSNRIEPLSVNIKNLAWWNVPYDDRNMKNGMLPYYNQIISSYYPFPMSNRVTTCQSLMKKYGHYIFGIYKENNNIKRFVYGIPGEFKREEQPYKGITGFKNWSYKNKSSEGSYGYWIAFIDSTTGEITEPPQIALGK